MNEMAFELVDDAITSGINTKYVLFNSWYSSPRLFSELLKPNHDGLGVLKSILSLSRS